MGRYFEKDTFTESQHDLHFIKNNEAINFQIEELEGDKVDKNNNYVIHISESSSIRPDQE